MKKQTEKVRRLPGTALLLLLALAATPALAETDRITVEDPATGVVKFKVTSDGNVSGASYTGDGAGLANVPHWKGTWSAATAYAKDDCVLSGGSSWIALQAGTNLAPSASPASWAVLAQQGPAGATGANGGIGPQGPAGATGPQGPAGSPDTQVQILGKLATVADGAVLAVQQGPAESGSVVKMLVKDNAGNSTYTLSSNGNVAFINPTGQSQIAQRTYTSDPNSRPVFGATRGRLGAGNVQAAVQLNDKLGTFSFGGYDGSASQTGALLEVFVDGTVNAGSVPSRFSIVTGSSVSNRAERLVVKSDGRIGVGTSSPTQALEINGGIRVNTASIQPACDSTVRGTFWLTQKGTGAMDTLEVCIKNATEAYVWKAVW